MGVTSFCEIGLTLSLFKVYLSNFRRYNQKESRADIWKNF